MKRRIISVILVLCMFVSLLPAAAMAQAFGAQEQQSTDYTLEAGKTLQFNSSGKATSYISSNASVATVDGSGLITGVAPGTVTITMTSYVHKLLMFKWGKTTAKLSLTVVEDDGEDEFWLSVGEEKTLPMTGDGIRYTTSMDNVATVSSDGVVTGVGEGIATVVATKTFTVGGDTGGSIFNSFLSWFRGLFGTNVKATVVAEERYHVNVLSRPTDLTDTDGEGLIDYYEKWIGTDINLPDTDNDGLSDYDEYTKVRTDPTLADTDGNGINDFNDDNDADGISNGSELALGTDPNSDDTDCDGLTDNDEIDKHKTDPLNDDTDGDGASDGWEVNNGFDPKSFDASFDIRVIPEEPSPEMPVSAGAVVTLEGGQVEELVITPLSISDNPLLSSSIAGYLGQAYEFNANGAISGATISFRYDASLGTLGTDFQPRIYYLNEENGTLQELDNQKVTDGQISADVTHFSTYILLNKVEFDKVWETEIKHPIIGGEGQNASAIDVVFAIDVSNSMNSYNRLTTAKSALNTFLDALNENDRAALVKFNSSVSTVSGLTSDISSVKAYVSGLSANGNTSMYLGLGNAIDLLTDSDENYGYKMIVILSDGSDVPSTSYSKNYASLVQRASDNDIVVYTVGAGTSVSTSILTQIANDTGGAYYTATVTSGITDAFAEIQTDTVDLTTDTNHDGIPDYFNDMILNGTLVLSNGSNMFEGIDFNTDKDGNLCADKDGDGLKNGEELIVTYDEESGRVFITMKSNPLREHSDGDGISDKEEVENGSDPLHVDFDGNSFGMITETDWMYYNQIIDLYENDTVFRVEQEIFGKGLTDGFRDIAKKDIINYFYLYANDDYMESLQAKRVALTVSEQIDEIVGKLLKYIDYIKKASGVVDTIEDAEVLEKIKKAASIIENMESIGSDLYKYANYKPEWFEEGVIKAMRELLEQKYEDAVLDVMELSSTEDILGNLYIKVKGISEKYESFMDKKVLSDITIEDFTKIIKLGNNIAEEIVDISKVNVASEVFEANLDVLIALQNQSKYDRVSKAAQDVINAMGAGMSSYCEEMAKAVMKETTKALCEEIKDTVLKDNPVAKGIKIAMSVLKLIGADKTPKTVFDILTYKEMINVVDKFCADKTEKSYYLPNYYYFRAYDDNGEEVIRYLVHSAQLNMLAENAYKNMSQTDKMHDELADENIESLIKWSNIIALPLSNALLKEIGHKS